MLKIENLNFKYNGRDVFALDDISISVDRGSFCVVCGVSGSGKTTLLRLLMPEISTPGVQTGGIFFDGVKIEDAAAKIGFVSQSPENQIVTDKVWHELAFGLENLGLPQPEIRLRTAEIASFFGIEAWFHKPTYELSGGQKQIVLLASVMAMQPEVILLDEPTSQLDPIAAGEFIALLDKINREFGTTIILAEHRLEEVLAIAGRVIVMDAGRIIAGGSPQDVGMQLLAGEHRMFAAMPTPMRVWAARPVGNCPLTVKDGAAWLGGVLAAESGGGNLKIDSTIEPANSEPWSNKLNGVSAAKPGGDVQAGHSTEKFPPWFSLFSNKLNRGSVALKLDDIWFKYAKNLPDVVRGLSLAAHFGQITAILGGNGSGKTTSLNLMAGIFTPSRGKVFSSEQVYMLPQNPQTIISNSDMSGGELQLAALEKILQLSPKILLLDEPTKGLDAAYKKEIADKLQKLKATGVAIIIVSHDIEFCAETADRCALFFDGSIIAENTPREFFGRNAFYTTAASRMSRHVIGGAVTAGDVIAAISGEAEAMPCSEICMPEESRYQPALAISREPNALHAQNQHPAAEALVPKCTDNQSAACQKYNQDAKHPKNESRGKFPNLLALALLGTIPLTILLGITLLNSRQFYITSIAILAQTIAGFFIIFEQQNHKTRKIVAIAVLCAIAVAGRAAFFMLPQFKPTLAIVIIAGAAFGGGAGFVVGAVTAFVSNMFFGQGPWTPWQMFAMGIVGFLSGVIFSGKKPGRMPLAIFGAVATFVVYGGIMNPASVLIFQPAPTFEMFVVAFLYGMPFDAVHALATVVFLWLAARPMLDRLEKVSG